MTVDVRETAPTIPMPRVAPADVAVAGRAAGRIRAGVRRASDHVPIALLYLFVLTLTLLQRIVLPGTVVFIALPIAFAVLTVLAVRGDVVADVPRTVAYLAAVGSCCLATLVSTGWTGLDGSLTSLGLLAVLYLPCCARFSPTLRQFFPRVLEFFQKIMSAAAIVCIGQYAAQVVGGWTYEDLLGFLPPALLPPVEGYNLSYPLYYGSPIFKSNGIAFLEPSFCSQFLALAIIVQLLLGGRRWRLVLLGAGLVTTFSGTGLLLLGAGFLVLAVRRGGQWTARASVAALVAAVAVSFTPAGTLLADRSTETTHQGSSGNMRFIAPYELVLSSVPTDPATLLAGRGPGSITRDVVFFNPDGIDVNYPAVPKLLGEYGVPATLVFVVFLLTIFFRGVPSPTLGVMACMLYFVLSGALLTAPIVYLSWFITGLFATGSDPGRPRKVR
jgi:hypothetical protein